MPALDGDGLGKQKVSSLSPAVASPGKLPPLSADPESPTAELPPVKPPAKPSEDEPLGLVEKEQEKLSEKEAIEPKAWVSAKWAGLMGTFVDYLGLGSIFPLIPYFVQEQKAHVVWLGAIISCQYVGVTIGSQFFGRLCDKWGPKKVMTLVLIMDVILFFFTGMAPNVWVMVLMRFSAGFFTPMPVGTAWIGICVPDDQKAKAFHANTLALLSGFIMGTALGALAADLFYACLASSVAALIILLLIVFGTAPTPPKLATDGESLKPEGVWKVLMRKEWQAAAFISYNTGQEGAACGPVLGYLYAGVFGYTERQTGWVFCGIVIVLLIVNVCLMDRIAKIGHALKRVVFLGFLEMPAYLGLVILFTGGRYKQSGGDIVCFFLIVGLFSFNTMLHPTSFDLGSQYADKYGKNCQGTILGIQNSFYSVGNAVGPLVSTSLLAVDTYPVFLFMFSGLLVVVILNGFVWMKYKKNLAAIEPAKEAKKEGEGEDDEEKRKGSSGSQQGEWGRRISVPNTN